MERILFTFILLLLTASSAASAQRIESPCIVSPFSDRPSLMQDVMDFGPGDAQPMAGAIYIGHGKFGDHYVSANVDNAFNTSVKPIRTTICSRLYPGSNRDKIRAKATAAGSLNADRITWAWSELWYDRNTREETELSTMFLDDHGVVLGARGAVLLQKSLHRSPGDPLYHTDVANFLFHYREHEREHLTMLYGKSF